MQDIYFHSTNSNEVQAIPLFFSSLFASAKEMEIVFETID